MSKEKQILEILEKHVAPESTTGNNTTVVANKYNLAKEIAALDKEEDANLNKDGECIIHNFDKSGTCFKCGAADINH